VTKPRIVVSKDGPYVVTGTVPLAIQTITPNAQGESWDWVQGKSFETHDTYELCRCGRSRHKPFCDGSHTTPHFHGAETASRAPFSDQAERIDGPAITLDDAQELCAFARFCDAGGKIWALIDKSNNGAVRELAVREANHCPSGRLVVNDTRTDRPIEHALPPSIGIVEDPAMKCSGPLWVRGGIPIESADGTPYEVRNRVTLCRCGASDNKPFCNGSHASVKFKDGLT
jgi:CDGSH-type Zn-finger protein